MESSKRQKRLFTFITAVIVLFLCLGMAEVGIRIYHSTCDRERFIWLPDEFLSYVHSSDNKFRHHYTEKTRVTVEHRTNNLGFLGNEDTLKKRKDTFRILVLGDSFTEALQVPAEQNYCDRLERYLNNFPIKKHNHIEVLNAGVSGYSPLNYYLYAKRELAKLKPDLVIVQLFANDVFEDNTARAKSLLDENGLPLKTHRYFLKEYFERPPVKRSEFNNDPFWYRVRKFLIDHSRAYEYFYVKFYNMKKASKFNQKMIRVDQYGTGYQFFILDPDHVLSKDTAFRDKAWGYTQKYLLALKKEAEKNKAQFMMVYMPMEVQLALDKYGTHVSLYVQKQMGTYFNDLLEAFSRENNIRLLDLLNNFEENKDMGLFLDRDGHLTEEGHRVAADTIFDYISGNNLLMGN